jgi:hypothetical protein
MDLDPVQLGDKGASNWARLGMLICFAVAASILAASLWLPVTAKSSPFGSSIARPY